MKSEWSKQQATVFAPSPAMGTMKVKWRYLALASLTAVALSGPAWSLTIVSPRPGEQAMPGQALWLIVQPDNGAEADMRTIQVLAPGAKGCENIQASVPIQCTLTVPDGSGNEPVPATIDIRVLVTFANGTESSASTHVAVATATETLTALRGDPREHPLMFDSVGQQKDLAVFGESTNGATHDLRGRRQGTIYDISNSAVVLVRDDGRAVAQGVGTATITVRNGALFFEVPVIVRGGAKTAR